MSKFSKWIGRVNFKKVLEVGATIGAVVGGPVAKIALPVIKVVKLIVPKKKKSAVKHGPYLASETIPKEEGTMVLKLLGLVKALLGSDPNGKPLYLSKTVLVNTLVGLGGMFYPPVSAWIVANPDTAMSIMAVVNIGLRFITKGKATLNK